MDRRSLKEIIMKEEISAGGIIVRDTGNVWEVLLMKDASGNWTFPKGLVEPGETLEDAATREIAEEVSLHGVKIIEQLDTIEYGYERSGEKFHKTVHYFLCRYAGRETPTPQVKEGVTETRWVSLEVAETLIGYPETNKGILAKTEASLNPTS